MRKTIFSLVFILNTIVSVGQTTIHTSDIDNFWVAYDSVQTTKDTLRQAAFIQNLYLDRASDGLKEFMQARQHSAKRHLKNILKCPQFWTSIRPYTLKMKSYTSDIEVVMNKFRELYPRFRQPDVYFMIGVLNSGGTITKDKVLIGTEISAADSAVDASELGSWLQGVFKNNQSSNPVDMVAHEVVHTQQNDEDKADFSLLSQCIKEGSCDFIAELLVNKRLNSTYMTYGRANEKALWNLFQKEMNGQENKNWLYNGASTAHADLGYFIGYVICKSYYENSMNKKNAIKEIIEIDYSKDNVLKFLTVSKYQGGQKIKTAY